MNTLNNSTAPTKSPAGRILAAFPREPVNGAPEELRVTVAEYRGTPYLDLAVHRLDVWGKWWRIKGTSIRARELPGVVAALEQARATVRGYAEPRRPEPRQDRRERPTLRPHGRRPELPMGPSATMPEADRREFNELEE